MKSARFLGSAKDDLSRFPEKPRVRAGYEIFMVQTGREPADWKPMPDVGSGACEIRVRDTSGAYRVIYVTSSRMPSTYCMPSRRRRRRPHRRIWNWPGSVTGKPKR